MIEFPFILIFLTLAIAFCAFLASSFEALSSTRLSILADEGNTSAKQLQPLLADERVVSLSLLICQGVLTVLTSFWMGTRLYTLIDTPLYVLAIIGSLLIFVLLIRIIPNILGANWGKKSLWVVSKGITLILLLFKPLASLIVQFESQFTDAEEQDSDSSLQEFNEMLEHAHEDGALDEDEYRLLKNVIRFDSVLVTDVMTPRTVVFGAKSTTTIEEILQHEGIRNYSRFPIWDGNFDSVVGYVMTKDILWQAINGNRKKELKSIIRDVHFIPENIPLDKVLDEFLVRREHLFVVVDEYGGVEGLITMEDILETILGEEILDEVDRFSDLREIAKQQRNKRIAQMQGQNRIEFPKEQQERNKKQ